MVTLLVIPDDGPCAGHPCDNCHICQRGRCCRNDNPDYRLPEVGEWDGPIFGEIGVLTDDGQKVECHCCGKWFGHLGNHVWRTHNLTADEYRAIFGLRYQTGLIGPECQRKHREYMKQHPEHVARLLEAGVAANAAATPEQLSARSAGKKRRPETAKDPAVQAGRLAAGRRAGVTRRARMAAGELPKPTVFAGGKYGQDELHNRSKAALDLLREDDEWRREFAEKISEARGGRVDVTCATCGLVFRVQPHQSRYRKTCGNPDCKSAYLREKGRENAEGFLAKTQTPEAIEKRREAAKRRVFTRDGCGRITSFTTVTDD